MRRATLGALSLAAGVAALRALGRLGVAGSRSSGRTTSSRRTRKLGGILIDLRGEAAGPAYVVVGIGINVRLPASARERLAVEGVRGHGPGRRSASRRCATRSRQG